MKFLSRGIPSHNGISHEINCTWYMIWCASVASIAGFNVGWHIGVPNMPQDVIINCTGGTESGTSLPACLPMSAFTWGYTVAAFALGGFVGGLLTKQLNIWFSRRVNMVIAGAMMIIGGILSSTAINIAMYSIGRAFVGIASGMSGSFVAIYVSEISTNKSRGALGSFFEIFLNTGLLIAQTCGLYMSTVPNWRFLWAIPTFLAVVQIALLLFTVESPRRLCYDMEYDKAQKALLKLRNNANIDEEFQMLKEEVELQKSMTEMSMWEVLSWKNRRITWRTVIVIVVQIYNQIGGIGPMAVYSVGFFSTAFNGDTKLATDLVLAQGTAYVVSTFICIFTIHKVGRKGYMLVSTLGMTIGCVMIVIGSTVGYPEQMAPLIITGGLVFSLTYGTGCGVVPWIIAPELLPLRALASGSALGNGANWLANFVVNILWPYINAGCGGYSFTIFAAINFIGFLFMLVFLPETTGKNLGEEDDDDDMQTATEENFESTACCKSTK
ncbi:general substrate transporter [Dichotomocladium elegans]|nr:general substrate transporter [Dichotomocladium elegans]